MTFSLVLAELDRFAQFIQLARNTGWLTVDYSENSAGVITVYVDKIPPLHVPAPVSAAAPTPAAVDTVRLAREEAKAARLAGTD